MLNGLLAGEVAITACAGIVHPWAAFIIGLVAGLTYSVWSRAVLHYKLDDPVDAVAGED